MSVTTMSVSGGMIVLAIVIIRAVTLNRLPKKMFLALWGVALCRLLIPYSIPTRFSALSLIDVFIPKQHSGTSFEYIVRASALELSPKLDGASRMPHSSPIIVIWLLGMLSLLSILAVIYMRNHDKLRCAAVIRDNAYLDEWVSKSRLRRPLTILQSDRIISPLAVGIIKPRIILPKSMDLSGKAALDFVLAHEYHHIRRGDALWKMLALLAVCVHWFNPLVYLMFALFSRDLELTCDEEVVRRFGMNSRKTYANMLIQLAEHGGGFTPVYDGFSKNATRERIVSIMKIKKASVIGIVLAVVLAARRLRPFRLVGNS